ncbi:PhnD/SsuA/transferrin family substrate-binding protein [Litoribrevibacter euphylliae]|uniref:PhnD/SsuA/transferrin family substrate-binding protein n=1 Tax=Litoribrevibacter euphylliae TaxID=1834034 RepID=A0ABV7HL28_9GAMM
MRSFANQIKYRLLCMSMLLITSVPTFAEKLTSIYFYNPEINVSRNSTLKQKLDNFLAQQGSYQFQPVTDRKIFSQLIETQPQAVFIMSSWFYQTLTNKSDLTARLVGVKNNTPFFKKLLVIHQDHNQSNAANLIIASTGAPSYSSSVLQNILKTSSSASPDILKSSQILHVPKDLDALLSVGFGMAQAALSTEDSLNQLKRFYSNQHQKLKILGSSTPLMRALVVTPREASEQVDQLIEKLEHMEQHQAGKISLSLIGLDRWMQFKDAVSLTQPVQQVTPRVIGKSQGGRKP